MQYTHTLDELHILRVHRSSNFVEKCSRLQRALSLSLFLHFSLHSSMHHVSSFSFGVSTYIWSLRYLFVHMYVKNVQQYENLYIFWSKKISSHSMGLRRLKCETYLRIFGVFFEERHVFSIFRIFRSFGQIFRQAPAPIFNDLTYISVLFSIFRY